MNIKVSFIFIIAIVIPTSLLAYFGLLAVRSEKSIVEKNMVQKYKAMADIVGDQIKVALARAPEEALTDSRYWESLLSAQAALFKDEVSIFDHKGRPIAADDTKRLQDAAYHLPLGNIPYIIAVYERYPPILEQLEKRRRGLVLYTGLIVFSALSILAGSFYALRALAREWRLARLKSEFVSHLSHDLRRPLTSIRMFSEMLKDDHTPGEEKKKEYYRIISDESDKLMHLANNILDFSRIESGRVRYSLQPHRVEDLVRQVVERFKTYMVEAKRPLTLRVDKCPLVKIDEHALEQALMNLLTNAAKYSAHGSPIEVNVKNEKKEIVIEVIDQGMGIGKKDQGKIFRKFYRAGNPRVARIEGSGLGLALVKYTVEAHKGKVKVESEEGKGSKFSIVLPVG
jgi:signal transduction histidine kinase